jgi:hypothetical protein
MDIKCKKRKKTVTNMMAIHDGHWIALWWLQCLTIRGIDSHSSLLVCLQGR